MLALKPSEFIVIEYNLIADGVQAFRRGELPKADWPQAKLDGWNTAGMASYHKAMLQEHDADKVGV
jgi:hypothetical protein